MVNLEGDIPFNLLHACAIYGTELAAINIAMWIVGTNRILAIRNENTRQTEPVVLAAQYADRAMARGSIQVAMLARGKFFHPHMAAQDDIGSLIERTIAVIPSLR